MTFVRTATIENEFLNTASREKFFQVFNLIMKEIDKFFKFECINHYDWNIEVHKENKHTKLAISCKATEKNSGNK